MNLRDYPEGKSYLVNTIPFHNLDPELDISLLETQVDYCKSQKCDLIIVSFHWGLEFELYPMQNQIDIAHHIAEYGADLIVSHHAHVVQPWEYYKTRRDPDRIVPILYGQGNLSSLFSIPCSVLSLIANFKITKGTINNEEKTLIEDIEITPVFQLECIENGKPYLCIEKLCDFMIKNIKDKELKNHINEIAEYAALACGDIKDC